MRWLDGITDLMDLSLGKHQELMRTGKPGVLQSMGLKESETTERLNNNGLNGTVEETGGIVSLE